MKAGVEAACQDAVNQEEPVPGSTLCKSMVEVVIAMQGYEHFVQMMIEAANQEEAGGELRSYTLARYTLARIFSHAHVWLHCSSIERQHWLMTSARAQKACPPPSPCS